MSSSPPLPALGASASPAGCPHAARTSAAAPSCSSPPPPLLSLLFPARWGALNVLDLVRLTEVTWASGVWDSRLMKMVLQHDFSFFLCFFLAASGLHCCARASSSCGERGLLFVAVRGLLIEVASLVAEHGL